MATYFLWTFQNGLKIPVVSLTANRLHLCMYVCVCVCVRERERVNVSHHPTHYTHSLTILFQRAAAETQCPLVLKWKQSIAK